MGAMPFLPKKDDTPIPSPWYGQIAERRSVGRFPRLERRSAFQRDAHLFPDRRQVIGEAQEVNRDFGYPIAANSAPPNVIGKWHDRGRHSHVRRRDLLESATVPDARLSLNDVRHGHDRFGIRGQDNGRRCPGVLYHLVANGRGTLGIRANGGV